MLHLQELGILSPRFTLAHTVWMTEDEIVVCGRMFHTGAPVVLWTDPGGYDAYRVERRFGPLTNASWDATRAQGATPDSPNRYGLRREGLSADELEQVRGGGWDLPRLQREALGRHRVGAQLAEDRVGVGLIHRHAGVDGGSGYGDATRIERHERRSIHHGLASGRRPRRRAP